MTRKRFTKLAMSVGYSRNEANSLSKLISCYDSYEDVYEHEITSLSIDEVQEAFQNVLKAVTKVVGAISAGINAFAETVRTEMEKDNE